MADKQNEALAIWAALRPMIDREITEKTRSCVRARKMTVTTAVNSGKIGVAEAYGATIQLPYLSTLSPLPAVGDSVWVRYYMDDLSTAVIVSKGDGL